MKILKSDSFNKWLSRLKDKNSKLAVIRRIYRIEQDGHFGDYKQIDSEIYELRFFISGGIRVYFAIKDDKIILLFCGGDKDSQEKDIKRAREILKDY